MQNKIIKVLSSCYFIILLFSPVLIHSEEKQFTPPHLLFAIPSEHYKLDKPFKRPAGIASYKGDIYIADNADNRIIAMDEMGQTLFNIDKPGRGQGELAGPIALVVDEENLYVAETFNSRIQVFDRRNGDYKYIIDFKAKKEEEKKGEGGQKKDIPGENTTPPVALELDTKDRLYVVFRKASDIKIFDKKGNFKFKIGSRGKSDGEFSFAASIGINNYSSSTETKIAIVDIMNYRVQVFNEKGGFLFKFGKHSDEENCFLMPSIVKIDNQDRIYVYDRGKGRCLIFDKQGNYITNFGREEQLTFAEGMFIDPNNKIYIADTLNARVMVYGY